MFPVKQGIYCYQELKLSGRWPRFHRFPERRNFRKLSSLFLEMFPVQNYYSVNFLNISCKCIISQEICDILDNWVGFWKSSSNFQKFQDLWAVVTTKYTVNINHYQKFRKQNILNCTVRKKLHFIIPLWIANVSPVFDWYRIFVREQDFLLENILNFFQCWQILS